MRRVKESLQNIIENEPNTIRSCVAEEALAYTSDDISAFFRDLLNHGCISGMVSSLIYYADTHEFFDRHYDEIEDSRTDYEEIIGQPINIDRDLKNTLAWFAFESTARRMVDELRLEI